MELASSWSTPFLLPSKPRKKKTKHGRLRVFLRLISCLFPSSRVLLASLLPFACLWAPPCFLFRYRLLSELCAVHRFLFRFLDIINLLLLIALLVLSFIGPIFSDYAWNCGYIHIVVCRDCVGYFPVLLLSAITFPLAFIFPIWSSGLLLQSVRGVPRLLCLNLLGSAFVSIVNIWVAVTFYTGIAPPYFTQYFTPYIEALVSCIAVRICFVKEAHTGNAPAPSPQPERSRTPSPQHTPVHTPPRPFPPASLAPTVPPIHSPLLSGRADAHLASCPFSSSSEHAPSPILKAVRETASQPRHQTPPSRSPHHEDPPHSQRLPDPRPHLQEHRIDRAAAATTVMTGTDTMMSRGGTAAANQSPASSCAASGSFPDSSSSSLARANNVILLSSCLLSTVADDTQVGARDGVHDDRSEIQSAARPNEGALASDSSEAAITAHSELAHDDDGAGGVGVDVRDPESSTNNSRIRAESNVNAESNSVQISHSIIVPLHDESQFVSSVAPARVIGADDALFGSLVLQHSLPEEELPERVTAAATS